MAPSGRPGARSLMVDAARGFWEQVLDAYSAAVVGVAEAASPGVVAVHGEGARGTHRLGSAFALTDDGLVLTNQHVVGGHRKLRLVTLGGSEAKDGGGTDAALWATWCCRSTANRSRQSTVYGAQSRPRASAVACPPVLSRRSTKRTLQLTADERR